jgi:hypothetical protein
MEASFGCHAIVLIMRRIYHTTSEPGSTVPNGRAAAWHSKLGASNNSAKMNNFGSLLVGAELRGQIWLVFSEGVIFG